MTKACFVLITLLSSPYGNRGTALQCFFGGVRRGYPTIIHHSRCVVPVILKPHTLRVQIRKFEDRTTPREYRRVE